MLRGAIIFVLAAMFTSVFFINFCASVFQCGCQSLWGEADKYCNIHNHAGRHCPWCAFGTTGYGVVYGTMLATQLGTTIAAARHGFGWLVSLAAAVAAFPASGMVLALVLGLYTGYWN